MSISNTSPLALAQQISENSTKSTPVSTSTSTSLEGPVSILWDIENCPVPSDVRPEDVAGNIRNALRFHPIINGAVTVFSAYGDFNAFPRRLREGCQRTGVRLIDVPNGRKDAADKAILVDMFLFALDNPPPSSIMLISGDIDFAPALHILGQRGYIVILVIPSGVGVNSALSNAGRFVWDWGSVARGEGFVPPNKTNSNLITGFSEGQNEVESIVYKGVTRRVSQSFSELSISSVNPTNSRSNNLLSCLSEASCDQNDLSWVQPGDLNGLKGQIVKLLELAGGFLPLTRLPSDYQKNYGRPLYVSEYGGIKLMDLLKKMADAISIEGKGQKRYVHLRSSKSGQINNFNSNSPVILARRDKKGKGIQENSKNDVITGVGSSDEFSEDENGEIKGDKCNFGRSQVIDQKLDKFRNELQEILVSYSCRIFLGCFEEIYQQRYKKPIDFRTFGVDCLEELLEKVRDVVELEEEPVSKKKFLYACSG